jgi:hypothetical protein
MGETSLALADGDIETARRLLPRAVEMLREQERWAGPRRCFYAGWPSSANA